MPASRLVRSELPAPLLAACLLLAACGGSTTEPPPPEPTTGTIEASAATTGEHPDPDGYTLTLDGGESLDLAPDGAATFEEVEEGDHELGLSGAAENCPVDGENPRTVTVVGGETASTTFDGAEFDPSWSPDGSRIAFESDRDGTWDIWLIEPGGENPPQLTNHPDDDRNPDWRP